MMHYDILVFIIRFIYHKHNEIVTGENGTFWSIENFIKQIMKIGGKDDVMVFYC